MVMKNPIHTHKKHQNRIDEIFGKISKFFSSSKPVTDVEQKSRNEYLAKVQKAEIELLNPLSCDSSGRKPNVKLTSDREIKIDNDKFIKNYSEIYFENLVNGTGMRTFRKINIKDLICYDLDEDIYGIAWLLDYNASYTANKISGKLLAFKPNQSVNFSGSWGKGKFYGKFEGEEALTIIKSPVNKDQLLKNFSDLQEFIKKTKKNFDIKFQFEDFNQLKRKVDKSDDPKLIKIFPEIVNIKKYLSTFDLRQGFGGSTYLSSTEIYKIKSKIDQNENLQAINSEVSSLIKNFKQINSKIDTFYELLIKETAKSNKLKDKENTKKIKF